MPSFARAVLWRMLTAFALACLSPCVHALLFDFGGQSMGTTSPPQYLSLTNNNTTASITITSIATTSQFSQTNDCGVLAPGQVCYVTLTFTPAPAAGALNSTVNITGTALVNYVGGQLTEDLAGVAEKSLVTHYYNAILNRAPDAAGKAFWQGEAARLAGLGANVNESWFVMAGYFFNSAEYTAGAKTDIQFVTDLYNTFFNRAPDSGGLGFWAGQIQAGLPREVVLFSFMFSPEFRTFAEGIFGNTQAAPEVDMVMDFYRGVLNRLPDSPAFAYWTGQLRDAQCKGAGAVYAKVDEMSYTFIFGAEYTNRQRTDTQFVTDMYYSFLRRGGDIGGVNFWISQLSTRAQDRNAVRASFIASPEFAARVNAIAAAACSTQDPVAGMLQFLRDSDPAVQAASTYLAQRIAAHSSTPMSETVAYLSLSFSAIPSELSIDGGSIIFRSADRVYSRVLIADGPDQPWTADKRSPAKDAALTWAKATSTVKNNKVLLLFPQETFEIGADQGQLILDLSNQLRAMGQQVFIKTPGQVDVQTMLSIDQYGMVIMMTHGAVGPSAVDDGKTRQALSSGQPATADNIRNTINALMTDQHASMKIQPGRKITYMGGSIGYTTDFFRALDLKDTILMTFACHTAESADDSLSAEVARQGGTLLGWNGRMGLGLGSDAIRYVTSCLQGGKSAQQCVQETVAAPALQTGYTLSTLGFHARISGFTLSGNGGAQMSLPPLSCGPPTCNDKCLQALIDCEKPCFTNACLNACTAIYNVCPWQTNPATCQCFL